MCLAITVAFSGDSGHTKYDKNLLKLIVGNHCKGKHMTNGIEDSDIIGKVNPQSKGVDMNCNKYNQQRQLQTLCI